MTHRTIHTTTSVNNCIQQYKCDPYTSSSSRRTACDPSYQSANFQKKSCVLFSLSPYPLIQE
uniref:Uncharacterized protein n=1 Tax=Solanum lycopersicum TaxID=4081 RepID=A0A3Q7HJN6_SOLLC